MDRVSLSSWTGRAVIQACGCRHPWLWKDAIERWTAWLELRRCGRNWYSGFWYRWRRRFWWLRLYSLWCCYYMLFLDHTWQPFPRQLTTARLIACSIVSFPSSCAPHSCRSGNSEADDERRHIHRKRMETAWTHSECVWKSVQTLRLRQIASCGQVSTTPRRLTRTQQSADQPLRSQIAVSLQALPAVPRRRNHCEVAELYPGAFDRDRAAERVSTSEELNLMATLREEPSMMKAPLPTKAFQTKVQVGWVPAPRCVSE